MRGLIVPALLLTVLFACSTRAVNTGVAVGRADAGGAGDGPTAGVDPDPDRTAACLPAEALRVAPGQPCVCPADCSTANCVQGVCCSGEACGARRQLGAPCTAAAQCHSGFCADGVCCTVACSGACVSCNQPDQMGECAPVANGTPDPHAICRQDAPESCGQSGFCNGQGGCARYSAGTVCKPTACQGRESLLPARTCDGEGTCLEAVAISCAPSTCEGNACLLQCSSDAQCVPPARCTSGSCGARGDGQDCTEGSQCASGKCVDSVCCNSDCAGGCQSCALPNARGKCSPVPAGSNDPRGSCRDQGPASCGNNARCDGRGACQRYPDGTVCRAASCDSAANTELPAGACQGGACNAPAARSCAPYLGCAGSRCATACGSDSQCAAGVCAGGSCGKRGNGASCSAGTDCASNICAQGRCCASACSGTCRSCSLAGQEGSCANVPAGGADPSGGCKNDGCANGCDGAGGCRREPPGTPCGPASCSGSTLVSSACNAGGGCESRSEACGGATPVCREGRCQMADPPRCTAGNCPGPCKVCVADTCVNAVAGTGCPDGSCNNGTCVPSCSAASCTGNQAMCQGGSCAGSCSEANCPGPCQTCSGNGRNCAARVNGSSCPGGTCQNGSCRPSPMCPAGCTGPCRSCNRETGDCVTAAPGSKCPGGNCDGNGVCIPADPCSGVDCGVNGSCGAGGNCVCRNGWSGNRCQNPPSDPGGCGNCAGPCEQCENGKCRNKDNGTACPGGECRGGMCMSSGGGGGGSPGGGRGNSQ